MTIRLDEWRAEIERVMGRSSDEGMASDELARKLGFSLPVARERLRALAAAGRLGCGRRAIKTIDGRPGWRPVYWLKEPAKAKRERR